MRAITDIALEGIRLDVKKAHELVHEAESAEEGVFLAARAQAWLGVHERPSPLLESLLAIGCDRLKRVPEALAHVERAIELDPADPTYQHSRLQILHKLRHALSQITGESPETEVLPIHALLLERGEATAEINVHVCQWYAEQQRWDEMIAFLEAVVQLNTSYRRAWEAMVAYAKAHNDEARLERAAAGLEKCEEDEARRQARCGGFDPKKAC